MYVQYVLGALDKKHETRIERDIIETRRARNLLRFNGWVKNIGLHTRHRPLTSGGNRLPASDADNLTSRAGDGQGRSGAPPL